MAQQTSSYGVGVELNLPYEKAVERIRDELSKEGFGVLTEIDVRATLKKKLDVDFRPYIILGACNPPIAHQALTAERDIGLLLPCNVIVYASDKPDTTVVSAIDPIEQLKITGNTSIEPFADEVRAKLERALRESGLSYAILRPTVLFGKEDILVNNIAWMLRRLPVVGVFGDGQYR